MSRKLTSALFFTLLLTFNSLAQQWRPVSGSRHANISGMALIEHDKRSTSVIVIHDNKKAEQMHATVITVVGSDSPIYTPLKWLGNDIPTDLESIASVPDRSGQFVALTGAGRAFHIKVDLKSATVETVRSFDVPMVPKDADFEAFDVQKINGTLIAVWAERGGTAKPATIFWGKFDADTDNISDTGWDSFRVPYPVAPDVRHVSEIKIDSSGAAFITATSDPGNDGPFASAFYYAGAFHMNDKGKLAFSQPAVLTPLFRFDYHKVEGFTLVPGSDGGIVFGTDDENLGSAICLTW